MKRVILVLVCCIICLSMYVASYLLIRDHRLSLQYAQAHTMFSPEEDIDKYFSEYESKHKQNQSIRFDDDTVFSFVYLPIICIDGAITDRRITTVFTAEKPYGVPQVIPAPNQAVNTDLAQPGGSESSVEEDQ